jgi:hypothetical protein
MPPLPSAPRLASLRARLSGRAWWVARYRDGREVGEWECDWTRLRRQGLVELRLHCPNGQVAVLGNSAEAGERLFQFKIARLAIGARLVEAQVIGLVRDTAGACVLWAWETEPRRLVGPLLDRWTGRGLERYGGVATRVLSAEALGLRL